METGDDGGSPSLEERLEGLNLQGEEEEDLDFSSEFEGLVKDVRWLALFRVNTSKPFSHAALFSAMRNAWAAAKEVTFKVMGPNLFLVQLHCLGDWSRVMDGRSGFSEVQLLCWRSMTGSQTFSNTSWTGFQFGREFRESQRG